MTSWLQETVIPKRLENANYRSIYAMLMTANDPRRRCFTCRHTEIGRVGANGVEIQCTLFSYPVRIGKICDRFEISDKITTGRIDR